MVCVVLILCFWMLLSLVCVCAVFECLLPLCRVLFLSVFECQFVDLIKFKKSGLPLCRSWSSAELCWHSFFSCLYFVYILFTVENFPVEMWVSLSGENQLCPKSHLVPNLIRHQTLVKCPHNFARTFCFTNIGSAWSNVTHVCRTLVPQVFCLVWRTRCQGCWDCLWTLILCSVAL